MQPRHSGIFLLTTSLLFVVVISPKLAHAQDSNDDWQTLRPDGEEFSISIPRNSKSEMSEETYHRIPINAHWYLSLSDKGPVFAVVSLSGIKSNPAAYTEAQRLNSYVDAFRTLFAPRVRGKDAVGRLTVIGDKTLNGNAGREYRMTIGELAGTVQVFATRRRFYAVAIMNSKKDDVLADKFLSSFYLPERQVEVSTTAVTREKSPALENPATGNEAKKPKTDESPKPDAPAEGDAKPSDTAGGTANTKPVEKPGEKAPINGGLLNGKALFLPKPDYPPEAKAAGAHGTVMVQVTIDEFGNVISAKAVSGPPSLFQSCVNAALAARFSQTTLMGEPVKVNGIVTYNFIQ